MRILVATDFSIWSHKVLRRAGLLAGPRRGKLMPMHVVEGFGNRQVAQDVREVQRMILEQIAVVPELLRTWCEPIVIGGEAAGAVLDAASAWEIDLIVVGSPSELPERSSGKTLKCLIRRSPCPVPMVRQPVEDPYGRVLAPRDLSDATGRVLRSVASLGLADGAEVTVLHAFRAPARTKLPAVGISKGHVDSYVESWRTGFAGELDGVLTRVGLGRQDCRQRVEEGRPRDVILGVAEEYRADLVAIGTHGRTGLARVLRGSVSEDLLSTSGPDVLMVPPPQRTLGRPTWLRPGASPPPESQPAPGFAVTEAAPYSTVPPQVLQASDAEVDMNTRRIDAPVIVQSSSISLGAALRARARTGVERTAAKYFGRLNAATVYFSRDGRGYRCTVNIDMGSMRIVTGESLGFCCHAVLDAATRKAAKQLRRLKRALRDDKLPRSGRMPGAPPSRRRSPAGHPREPETVPQGPAFALWGSHGFDPDAWEETEPWCDELAYGISLQSPGRAGATLDDAEAMEAVLRKVGEACSVGGERRIPFVRKAQAKIPERCP